MMTRIIDGIEFRKSTRDGKKYMARKVGTKKWVHFGQRGAPQFHDRIGEYSDSDHHNSLRRKRYRDRHKAILTSSGKPAYRIKYSPAYYSYYYLW